jgi:hypothetical protein
MFARILAGFDDGQGQGIAERGFKGVRCGHLRVEFRQVRKAR